MSDSKATPATLARLAAKEARLKQQIAKSELQQEFYQIIAGLLKRKGGDCAVGDVLEEVVAIWQQRHPGTPVPM